MLLGLALIQSSLVPFMTIVGVHPNLVLVAVIGWTLLRGPGEGLVWAIVGGLALDLLSSGPFGAATFALVITSALASLGYGRVFGGYLVLPLALTFPLSLAYYLIYLVLLSVFNTPVAWVSSVADIVLPTSLVNMAAMFVLFPLLRGLHRRTGREEIGW